MLQFAGILFIFISSLVQAQNLKDLVSQRLYLTVGEEKIEVQNISEIYELNSYQRFWLDELRPSLSAIALKEKLQAAEEHGLDSKNYWTPQLDRLFLNLTDRNSLTFDLLMTDTLVRFVKDLSQGQILDPDLIDEDIKMTRKDLVKSDRLYSMIKNADTLKSQLDSLAPQSSQYLALKNALLKLKQIDQSESWGSIIDPGSEIRPGGSHASVPEIKKRLNDLGYRLTNQTAVFDPELQAQYKKFLSLNSLPAAKNLNRAFYKMISQDLKTRIQQIEANMEKLRWFPQFLEPRHLFVNLAFQEATVFENHKPILSMRTVNGRPTRRTPTLKDEIRYVEPYPTWTVPFSIAVKDKLDLLKSDPGALNSQGIFIFDQSRNQVDPFSVNWFNIDRSNFRYVLVQQPGAQNALGLVKFPLTNPWFIFLHDTNEPQILKDTARLRSSGCVRLEKPWELVQYLFQDQPDMTKAKLLSPQFRTRPVFVKNPLPVYFLFLTVEVTDIGEIRFAQDNYGQDKRLIELFNSRGSNEKF
jgi:murein L,D-transpeptidase YcbB/YkuD